MENLLENSLKLNSKFSANLVKLWFQTVNEWFQTFGIRKSVVEVPTYSFHCFSIFWIEILLEVSRWFTNPNKFALQIQFLLEKFLFTPENVGIILKQIENLLDLTGKHRHCFILLSPQFYQLQNQQQHQNIVENRRILCRIFKHIFNKLIQVNNGLFH